VNENQDKFIHELKNVRVVYRRLIHNTQRHLDAIQKLEPRIKDLEDKVNEVFSCPSSPNP